MDIKDIGSKISRKLFTSDFIKHTFFLSSGTFIAQLIPLGLTPVLSRNFSPDDFGIYGVFFTICSMLSYIINGRYEQAVMIVKEDEEAIAMQKVSFLFSLVFTALLFLIVCFVWFFKISNSTITHLGWQIFLIPVASLLGGMVLIGNIGMNRNSFYKQISISKILGTLFTNVLPLIFILILKPRGSLLIICWLVGQFISVSYLTWFYRKRMPKVFDGISSSDAKKLFKKFKQFPLINTPFSMLDTLGASLPIFFISSFFGMGEAGHFNMAMRIIAIPSVFITAAIAQVFFQKITSYIHDKKPVKKFIVKTFVVLLVVGAIPFTVLIFAGQPIFSFFFGSQWVRAGWFVQILSISAILRFAISPLSNLFVAAQKIKLLSVWQLSYFAMNLMVIGLGYYFKKIEIYLWMYVIGDIIMYIIYLGLMLKLKLNK